MKKKKIEGYQCLIFLVGTKMEEEEWEIGELWRTRAEMKVDHLSVEGKIRKRVSIPIGLILTQQIVRIKNTKPLHDRINKRISVSFFKGASNIIYEEDMINVSYPTSLS
jgi:hypothetical protein